ncbi:MAG: phosphate ABC transporter permease subunit PstC, partial [Bacteroidales bacterium]
MRQIKLTRYRKWRNLFHQSWMVIALLAMLLIPLVLVAGLILKSMLLLNTQSVLGLLTSTDWKPLSGQFGFLPFIVSSLWITILSLLISAPVCLLTAIHLTQYAKRWVLRVMHPVIDILAGIPSVIFGVWGILVIVPFISHQLGPLFG